MKVLRMIVSGLELYEGDLDLALAANQEGNEIAQGCLHPVAEDLLAAPVLAFTGLNASGKSVTLKVIQAVFSLLNGKRLNTLKQRHLLLDMIGAKPVLIQTCFVIGEDFYFLKTKIGKRLSRSNRLDEELIILEETLYQKDNRAKTAKRIWMDDPMQAERSYRLVKDRKQAGDYLPDDTSLCLGLVNKTGSCLACCDLSDPLCSHLFLEESFLPAILNFLDPTIDFLKPVRLENGYTDRWVLKFKNWKRKIYLNSSTELAGYLSSGTLRGKKLFGMAAAILKEGGCLLADDLESHLNRKAVNCLLELFMSRQTNKKGAAILFSMHDPELLDVSGRQGLIYILSKPGRIQCRNLYSLNWDSEEMKDSEADIQNLPDIPTAPAYSAWHELKRRVEAVGASDRCS